MSFEPETIGFLDAAAETFEDYVSRGELVDMMAAYILEKELEDEVFGPEEDDQDEDEPDE